MPLPVTKQELADWILRRLGAPVVNVEITDVQLEDAIDEAVQFFQWYHYDGAERTYRTLKIGSECVQGQERMHQMLCAPMYDVDKSYRVGERVMTYKANGTPDKVWIKFDSDERIVKRFCTIDANGTKFVYDSDMTFADLEHVNDSDDLFVDYDSDTHTITVYYASDIGHYHAPLAAGTVPLETEVYYIKDSENADSEYRLYDSDRDVIAGYTVAVNGAFVDSDSEYVAYDSDKHVTIGYEPVVDSDTVATFYVDSDSEFVLYDSDKHAVVVSYVSDPTGDYVREEGINRFVLASTDPAYAASPRFRQLVNRPTLYAQADQQPTRYSYNYSYPQLYQRMGVVTSWVDSDGQFVLYDSDRHVIFQYDSESTPVLGLWTDSDSDKVLYDSDRHILLNYFYDSEGSYIDSDSEFVFYDSDKHAIVEYYEDSELGMYTDSDSDGFAVKVLYDSDKHVTKQYDFVTKPYDLLGADIETYYWLKSEHGLDSEYELFATGVDTIYEYARTTQTLSGKTNIADPTTIVVNGNTITVDGSIRSFELRGTTETATDSDGSGSLLQFADLNNLRLKFTINAGSIVVQTFILDQTIRQGTQAPVADGFVTVTTSAGVENLVFNATYTRHWINENTELYRQKDVQPIRYNYGVNRPNPNRRSRSSSYPKLYSRQFTYPVRYLRRHDLRGVRFNCFDSEIDRTRKTFEQMWRREDIVLTEQTINTDYSKTGKIGIPVPENIIGINKVLRIDNFSGIGMWNYEYQFFLNNFDFFYGNGGASSQPMTNYYTTKSYMDMIDHMMNVQPAIRFSKVRNRLYIDTNWSRLEKSAGNRDYYLMVECYEANDPEVFGDVYKDKWLKRYATALAMKQWGANLMKYSNTDLPGGLQVDGKSYYEQGKEDAEKLEEELKNSQLEMDFLIG